MANLLDLIGCKMSNFMKILIVMENFDIFWAAVFLKNNHSPWMYH